jgi:bacterioferritin B
MTTGLTCGSVAGMNDRGAQKSKFHALLQDQIFNEFTSAQQYIAIAVYFDDADLPQLAKHFYSQALEERNHAMMLVQYLLDRDVRVEIPGVDGVRNQFDAPRAALALALDQERAVTEQVSRLSAVARDEGDHLGEQFMQWFLKEQVEEMALMTTLLRIAERAGTNWFELENFVAREIDSAPRQSDAPHAAGGR